MTDVAVIGSLNMDLVTVVDRLPRPGETVAGPAVRRSPGGKGANQAVAAARLGGRVRLAGVVGDDAFGAEIRDAVAAHGVDVTGVEVCAGHPTGTALITVEDGGENTIVVAAGANAAATPETFHGAGGLKAFLNGADVVLLQLEIPVGTCVAAARAARELGIPVVLNAAPCPPAHSPELTQLLHSADVLIVNETEATALAGGTDTAAVRTLGPQVAVVTLGRRGAVARDAAEEVSVTGFAVPSVDAVGAGDTFCGQFTLAHAAGLPLAAALRRACAAGALATTAYGTQTAVPAPDRVAELLARTG